MKKYVHFGLYTRSYANKLFHNKLMSKQVHWKLFVYKQTDMAISIGSDSTSTSVRATLNGKIIIQSARVYVRNVGQLMLTAAARGKELLQYRFGGCDALCCVLGVGCNVLGAVCWVLGAGC